MSEFKTADLLVEIGCEELPPKSLESLSRAFFDGVCDGLAEARVEYIRESSRFLFTPRRMTVLLRGVADRQPDKVQERRGPARSAAFDETGAPTPAAAGFAHSVGMEVDDLDTLRTDKGEWLYCKLEIPGKPLTELIFPILRTALDTLPIPRPMRWADHEFSFVRPVHWLLALHGEEALEGMLLGCSAGRFTRGHRIHAPGPFEISDTGSYVETLRSACVEVDQDSRIEKIREFAALAGKNLKGETRITDELLAEVNNLVEWPVAVPCRFDEDFLSVPQEALIASMEDHQKFFPVLTSGSGQLMPAFVAIANLESQDMDSVRRGFERVIRPRLADAQFFWKQDLKTPLEENFGALDGVVFQKKLGTVGEKSRRIADFSQKIADLLGSDPASAQRAALLSKCDLVSQMVGEFPELQGIMGGYYAEASGEAPEVSSAIGCHYLPRFAGDKIPPGAEGRIVAIADRMDTMVGIFAAGLKPSGNKDPFALRRAALGVIRILLEGNIGLSLHQLLELSSACLASRLEVNTEVRQEVLHFMLERLRHLYMERGYSANEVKAVLSAPLASLTDLNARLEALSGFMRRPESGSLVAANKRIGNILSKQAQETRDHVNERLFILAQERQLFEDVNEISDHVRPLFESGDYPAALEALAGLKNSVDEFFDHVLVMDEDLSVRENRLALLAQLKALFDQVADFSQAA